TYPFPPPPVSREVPGARSTHPHPLLRAGLPGREPPGAGAPNGHGGAEERPAAEEGDAEARAVPGVPGQEAGSGRGGGSSRGGGRGRGRGGGGGGSLPRTRSRRGGAPERGGGGGSEAQAAGAGGLRGAGQAAEGQGGQGGEGGGCERPYAIRIYKGRYKTL
ncbi:hypothetical protein B484DRAFT_247255, partial [Ochromonadaceae sp. CCMP2298]